MLLLYECPILFRLTKWYHIIIKSRIHFLTEIENDYIELSSFYAVIDTKYNVKFHIGQKIRLSDNILTIIEISTISGLPGQYLIFNSHHHPINIQTAANWLEKFEWFNLLKS